MAKEERLDTWFVALVDKVDNAVDSAMEQIAEEGEAMVHDFILSRGTGKTWKRVHYKRGIRRTGSVNGREWTGDMRSDVISESGRRKKDVAVASFGWLETFKDYYGQQEVGFEHPQTGDIPGMFAMRDAADLMQKRAEEIIGVELRRV